MKIGKILTAVAIAAGLHQAALAATPVIVAGQSNLLPNQAGQTIQILVSGTDQIVGTDLYFQMDPVTGTAPSFTDLTLLSVGSIFATNNTTEKGKTVGTGTLSNFAAIGTTTATGTVTDAGTLVTLTISTVGLSAGGVFHLNMASTYNNTHSDFVKANVTRIFPDYGSDLFTIGTAPDRQWNVNGGGTWGTDSNWTPFAPYTNGDKANFLTALTSGTAIVSLDGDRTSGSITFNNTAGSYIIAPGSANSLVHLNDVSPSISDLGGNHTISAGIVLSANTSVNVSRAVDTLTLSGALTGNMNLALSGLGKLVLSGANSLSGGSIGTGATMVFATAVAASGAGLNETNDGTMMFSQTDGAVVPISIIGAGALTQAGGGTTTLTGANGYSGPTLITAGKLIIGNNGTTGTLGTGQITNSAALVFNRTNALSVSAAVSGAGILTHAGVGTTTLAGRYTGTGAIQSAAGRLAFAGNQTNAIQTPSLAVAGPVNAPTSTVDLTHNKMIIQGTPTLGVWDTTNQVYTGALGLTASGTGLSPLGGGLPDWSGKGITTSAATSDTGLAIADGAYYKNALSSVNPDTSVFGGVAVNDSDTLIKYTWNGDTNLDGTIDFWDYIQIDSGVQDQFNPGFVMNYSNGDFNLDGQIDFWDYIMIDSAAQDQNSILDSAFGPLGSVAAGDSAGSLPAPALSLGGGGASAVPEPASLALLGIGAAGLLLRRKKTKGQ